MAVGSGVGLDVAVGVEARVGVAVGVSEGIEMSVEVGAGRVIDGGVGVEAGSSPLHAAAKANIPTMMPSVFEYVITLPSHQLEAFNNFQGKVSFQPPN